MTLRALHEARAFGMSIRRRAPPIPVCFSGVGPIGLAHSGFPGGLYVNSALRRQVAALIADGERLEREARLLSNGRIGADVYRALARGTDSSDAISVLRSARAALGSWDNFVSAKTAGKFLELSQAFAEVAGTGGSAFYRVDAPSYGSWSGIPGGQRLNSRSISAFKIPISLGPAEHLFLSNFRPESLQPSNVESDTRILVDGLVGALGISATVNTTQTVATTSLSRWTSGEGNALCLIVAGATGATSANVTIGYTNQSGTSGRLTPAAGVQTSTSTPILTPGSASATPVCQVILQADDYGVRSIDTVLLTTSMGSGSFAAFLYRPLLLSFSLPLLAAVWETELPKQLSACVQLTDVAGSTELPYLTTISLHGNFALRPGFIVDLFWGEP